MPFRNGSFTDLKIRAMEHRDYCELILGFPGAMITSRNEAIEVLEFINRKQNRRR